MLPESCMGADLEEPDSFNTLVRTMPQAAKVVLVFITFHTAISNLDKNEFIVNLAEGWIGISSL